VPRHSEAEKLAIAQRRQRTAALYLRGRTQHEIALELDVNQGTVSRDLAALREEWKQSSLIDFDEARSRELARIDELERTYWEAWQRSCQDAETRTAETVRSDDGERTKAVKRVEGQSGSPAFLAGVERCIEMRTRLLGLNAPLKIAPTSPDGQQPATTGTDQLLALLLSLPVPAAAAAVPGQPEAQPAPPPGSAAGPAAEGLAPLP
jgi:hypothetical protein